MSFASLRRVLRSARKGLCSTCSKTKHPQLEAAGAGHVGCLMYTFETLGQLVKDEHDVTAVHVAARKGQSSILIYLIENGFVEGVPRAKNGATPAHDAAGTGNLDCLQYILSRTKASALDRDGNQATPLHWAVQSGHLKVVKWLVINANASVDSTANNGITPFHLAAAKDYLEILRWLTSYAYRNHPKPRRVINAKDKNGATPLYHAAHAGHLRIIQWLAEKGGGDPTIFNTQGHAPLHAATIAGHLQCVTYLFRFGSATAPGGLRSNDGASALHYAAADGHVNIAKWLLDQKECTGNERDYYQCTPLHDAAEHGHLKTIQVLCENGADHLLTDIEGNFPKDLAEKNHHNKCSKYLVSLGNSKTKTRNSSTKTDTSGRSSLKRRQNANKANMIDSYRNAPPHQRPVSVFDEDDEEEFESFEGDSQWETLHDLMDESELDSLTPADIDVEISSADRRRRDLEENMRREAEERQRRKRELQIREREYEEEIRERLMAEEHMDEREPFTGREKDQKRTKRQRKTDEINKTQHSDIRRLSQPAQQTSDSIGGQGIVEKRTWEYEARYPGGKTTLLSKLWPGKKSNTGTTNSIRSSDSSVVAPQDPLTMMDDVEEGLPSPPPLPTIDYLLGKRPNNLRGSRFLSHQDKYGDEEHISDESDHSSENPLHNEKLLQQKKKAKKKKRKGSRDDDAFDWQYNKLTVPQSSPPREKKRKSIPQPVQSGYGRPWNVLTHEAMARPFNALQNSPSPKIHSSQSSVPHAFKPKSKIAMQQNRASEENKMEAAGGQPTKTQAVHNVAVGKSKKMRLMLPEDNLDQKGHKISVHESIPPTKDTSSTAIHSSQQYSDLQGDESESESSDYTSSSDDSASSTEDSSSNDSSDEESELLQAQMPKRPIMAKNIGMGSPRNGVGAMSRSRFMARYPRLLRRKPIHLTTVEEVAEEIVHEAETHDQKAVLFRRVRVERRIMRSWRKYVQIMKTIYRKAEKMAQRRRRDLIAQFFYAWIQVRNLGTVMKNDIDRAITYHDKRLMKRVFNAWYFTKFGAKMPIARSTSMQLMNAELEYIDWLNGHLPQSHAVSDISESLADGTLMLKALSNALGRKAPKHNSHPKVHLHRQDNWKVAHEFMASAGINVKGIEPADLGNVNPAAIHNMFISIFKWEERDCKSHQD